MGSSSYYNARKMEDLKICYMRYMREAGSVCLLPRGISCRNSVRPSICHTRAL